MINQLTCTYNTIYCIYIEINLESLTRTNTEISTASGEHTQQQKQATTTMTTTTSTKLSTEQQQQLGIFSSNNTTIGKPNPIQVQALKTSGFHAPLKPFDPPINNQTNVSSQQQHNHHQSSSHTPGSMSRDNSTLINSQLSRYNTIINSSELMNEGGKLANEAIPKLLQIKQLNTSGTASAPKKYGSQLT